MSASFPSGDVLDAEAQRARFLRVDTGEAVASGPLTLLVPRGWNAMPPPDQPVDAMDGLRLVAFWTSEGHSGGPLSIQVFRAHFPREIRAEDYLRRLCVAMRYQILAIRPLAAALADAAIAYSVGKALFQGRLVVRLYGAEVVAALASGPQARDGEAAELYGYLVRAASVEGVQAGGPMEPRQPVALGPHLACELPASWPAEVVPGPDPGRGAVDARSTTLDGTTLSQLRLKWRLGLPDRAPDGEIRKLGQELASAGFVPRDLRFNLRQPIVLRGGLVLRARTVQTMTSASPSALLEAERFVITGEGITLAGFLICPAPETDGPAWALARRAREIAFDSIGPV